MSEPAQEIDQKEIRALAAVVAAGILSNPQVGMVVSTAQIKKVADLSIEMAKAIAAGAKEG